MPSRYASVSHGRSAASVVKFPAIVSALALPLLLTLLLTGCGMLPGGSMQPTPPPPSPAEQNISAKAEAAYTAGNYTESLRLYRQLLQQPGLTSQQLSTAWERMVTSALKTGDTTLALQSMTTWRTQVPGVEQTKPWQDAYFQALRGISDPAARETELLGLSSNESMPWEVRARAGIVLAALHWEKSDVSRAQMILSLIERQANERGQAGKAAIEGMLLAELSGVKLQDLEAYELLVPEEQRNAFPYTVIQLEKARRLAASSLTRNQAYTILQRVAPFLADRSLVQKVLGQDAAAPAAGEKALAMALPLTGPYGEVASKILRGAMAAQKDLADQGVRVDVQVLNTDAPSFMADLAALPPEVLAVGGPLRVDVFKQIAHTDAIRKHALFAFLATLGSVPEGQDAWRFFISAEDQVRALVRAATDRFGIYSAAVLYPQDAYGMHMSQLFRQQAMSSRMTIATSEAYLPSASEAWDGATTRVAQSGAGAVFIPGDWANAELLAPYLRYHDAKDMLIMGPSLWGPSIERKGYVEMPTFANTIFPGAWWPENGSPAAIALKARLAGEGHGLPDFWVALGYDFVRFAATLEELAPNWTPAQVNQSITQAQSMSWSMAPISWDSRGAASQDLFIFEATEQGYTLYGQEAAGDSGFGMAPASGNTTAPGAPTTTGNDVGYDVAPQPTQQPAPDAAGQQPAF